MKLQFKFGYCMSIKLKILHFVCKRDRFTGGRTDRQKDDPNTRCPRQTFQARGIERKIQRCSFLCDVHVNLYEI